MHPPNPRTGQSPYTHESWMRKRRTVEERFNEKWVEAEEPHPVLGTKCWLWTAGTTSAGYGGFYADGKHLSSHRVSYEMHVGPIQEGFDMDHLCRVHRCINPEHLEPVTHAENVRRGQAGKQGRGKTYCMRGHPLSGENLNRYRGRRRCRACADLQRRAWARDNPERTKENVRRQRLRREARSSKSNTPKAPNL